MPNPRGILLLGSAEDLEDWTWAFRPPAEPQLVWVERDGARHAVLKTTAFGDLDNDQEVYDRAVPFVERLNSSMALSGQKTKVEVGGVAEFRSGEDVRFNHFLSVNEVVTLRVRVGRPTITVTDTEGNVVPPDPPSRSEVQVWSALADTDDIVAEMLIHFGRADNWYDLYKTWELAKKRVGGEHTKAWGEITEGLRAKDMSRTANFFRHATTPRPEVMLEFEGARAVLRHIVHNVMKRVADVG
jgi:hypothetical protein